MTIDFVYFDLGNMLLSFDPADACRSLANCFGVSASEAKAALYDSGLEEEFEHGRLTPAQFAARLRDQFGRSADELSDQVVLDAISNMFIPIAAMEGVLRSVKGAGMGVGLLSNTCHAHWDWIRRQQYRVLDFSFDTVLLSFEVGSMKPDRKIYDAAVAAAGVSPERILFLDDRQENIDAALGLGWQAACCVGGPAAIEILQQLRCLAAQDGLADGVR